MMKNIAKNAIPKILSLAVLLLIMSGCLRDKLTECSPIEPNNNVKIDFTLFGGGVFTDDVTSVIAVLFDDEGTYIPPAITINKDSLEQYAGIEMALDPGDYRMVFWANIGENTEVKVVDDIPIIIYKNADRTSRRVVGNGDPVWYAPAVESVRVSEIPQPLEYHSFTVPVEGEYTDEVAFAKTHSLVDIYIKGLPLETESMPLVEITNLVASVEFFGMDTMEVPLPTVTSATQTVAIRKSGIHYAHATFCTSPLGEMEGINIVVKKASGEEIYRVSLIEAIAQSGADVNPNPNNYKIALLLDFINYDSEDPDLTVNISDWSS